MSEHPHRSPDSAGTTASKSTDPEHPVPGDFDPGDTAPPNRVAPILVTGSHRSGSTWLGRILEAAAELHYVQEPFNIVAHQRWMHPRPSRQFMFVTESNEEPWIEPVQRFIDLRYPLGAHLWSRPSLRMARRATRLTLDAHRARRGGAAALVKDPIAVFSAPWLARRFGVRPVVLVRDPVAFVGSLRDRDWTFDFRHWSEQPLLMEQLGDVAEDIERQAHDPGDIVEQGIVMWNAIYGFVAKTADDQHLVVRYETIAARPEVEVEGLYRRLGLRFGADQRAVLAALTQGRGTDDAPASAVDVRRDTSEVLRQATDRLDDAEAERVRADTAATGSELADLSL